MTAELTVLWALVDVSIVAAWGACITFGTLAFILWAAWFLATIWERNKGDC